MRKFLMVAVASLSFGIMASPKAATIVTSLSDWEAGAGASPVPTTAFGNQYDSPSSVALLDGQTLTFGSLVFPDSVTVLQTGSGWATLNGYSGQVLDTAYNSETINFSPNMFALGFFVTPDGAGSGSVTVTLSDSTSATSSTIDFDGSTTQFVGFYGGGETSISIQFNGLEIADFALGNVVDVAVPEPMSLALLLTGMTGLGFTRRRAR